MKHGRRPLSRRGKQSMNVRGCKGVIFAWLMVMTLACPVSPLCAAAAQVEIAQMTWVEVRDAIAAGRATVILPTGGTEQNGPHMITGKHNVIVAVAAKRIAEKLNDALVAPVLAYTPQGDVATREGHTAYPGTISIGAAAFEGVLEGAARSFAASGFKLIVFLGDSGPNQTGQERVAQKLNLEWAAAGIRVFSARRYYAGDAPKALLLGEGETTESIGVHAGIRDTSELMSVMPGGVRTDMRGANQLGANGDARKATPERGARLLDLRIAAAVEDIRAVQTTPLPPVAERGWFDWLAPKN